GRPDRHGRDGSFRPAVAVVFRLLAGMTGTDCVAVVSSWFVVSGAQSQETQSPSSRTPALMSITEPTPHESRTIGSRNVPSAAPMRLMAEAKPTPVARMSVGKISL